MWGESKVWKVDAEKQEAGGGNPNLALWHMDGDGVEERSRGPQGGSPQGHAIVEMEATKYTLQVEKLLQKCGKAHNAGLSGDHSKDLKMMESFEILDVFLTTE